MSPSYAAKGATRQHPLARSSIARLCYEKFGGSMKKTALMLALLTAFFVPITAHAQDAQTSEPTEQETVLELYEYTEDSAVFVMSNIFFITFHELGHALITELGLPVLGRQEDAVDQFATILLAPEPGESDAESAAQILDSAIAGWFLFGQQTAVEDIAWWDEHGDQFQRAYQIACLLYGADPQATEELADGIGLPAERRESCIGERETVNASWNSVLTPHLRPDDVAAAQIEIIYDDAGDYAAERELLETAQIMETAATVAGFYNIPRNLTIGSTQCGTPNAFWDSETGVIIICYEMMALYHALYAESGAFDEATGTEEQLEAEEETGK